MAVAVVRGAIRRFSDGTIQLLDVEDHSDPSTPLLISSLAVGDARLYDARRRSEITADLAATGTLLQVEDNSDFAVGDTIEIRLDDTTTLHGTTVATINTNGQEIGLTAAIPASRTAKKGGFIQKPIGSAIDITTLFGTPALNDDTWGYIGFVPDDLDLFDVEEVGIEVDVNNGAGFRLFKRRTEPVIEED